MVADLPKAYGGCTCICHREPGVRHIMACCHPRRLVMCKNDWPEGGGDFAVFAVRAGETDEQAIARAGEAYSPDNEFYIVDEA